MVSGATTTFPDEYHDEAVSEEELKYIKRLQEEYKGEIYFVKLIVKDNPSFDELSYEDKINFAVNFMISLQEKGRIMILIIKGKQCKKLKVYFV